MATPENDQNSDFDTQKIAHDYAWAWFQYHSGQRMNVFRFYFIVIALLVAGAIKLYALKLFWPSAIMFFAISVTSFLFSRLDTRGADLVKISESHLEVSELWLQEVVGDTVQLAHNAGLKNNAFAKEHWPSLLFSFRKVFFTFFLVFGLGGLVAGYIVAQKAYCRNNICKTVAAETKLENKIPSKREDVQEDSVQ